MFKIGDKVAHPSHGGCIICDSCMQMLDNLATPCMVLTPQNEPGMRIILPVASFEKIGIRKIISSVEADRLLAIFTDNDDIQDYESNFSKRRKNYIEILKGGSLSSLVDLIREISSLPKQGNSERELLPKAQKKLFSEIALAKGMDYENVKCLAMSQI